MSGNPNAIWPRQTSGEVARVPAHAGSGECGGPPECTNSEWTRFLRRDAPSPGRMGWSLRQIAKQMGTTATRVRELLRAREDPK